METISVKISDINIPDNVRLVDKTKDLAGLMDSIQHAGLLQPVGVTKKNGGYRYLWGSRRIKAAKKLGWKTISAVLMSPDEEMSEADAMIINTMENVQRQDIGPFELGRICHTLVEKGLTLSEVSARLGITKKRLSMATNLYKSDLPAELREHVAYTEHKTKTGKVSAAVAHAISMAKRSGKGLDRTEKLALFEAARQKELSLIQIRLAADLISGGFTVDEAVKNLARYRIYSPALILDSEKLEKLKDSTGETHSYSLVKGLIKGEYAYPQGLLR